MFWWKNVYKFPYQSNNRNLKDQPQTPHPHVRVTLPLIPIPRPMADSHKERSECRQRLLNALSAWEMAEFAIDPEDLGPMVTIFWGWSGERGSIWWYQIVRWCHPPKRKINIAPEKLPKPNRKVVFQPPFFRGHVKLRGCVWNNVNVIWDIDLTWNWIEIRVFVLVALLAMKHAPTWVWCWYCWVAKSTFYCKL